MLLHNHLRTIWMTPLKLMSKISAEASWLYSKAKMKSHLVVGFSSFYFATKGLIIYYFLR